ncbi:MAG TPA: ECF-type sigma factor [Steroidobacteraceae bacterium]|nr:ECF-type sigma factor [Steroidobacteraceae bacterium]
MSVAIGRWCVVNCVGYMRIPSTANIAMMLCTRVQKHAAQWSTSGGSNPSRLRRLQWRVRSWTFSRMNELNPRSQAVDLWNEALAGTATARDRLLELCYAELRTLARRMLAGDSASLHMQPTELANEAAIRVLKLDVMQWKDRAHFLATSATVMRQALLDEVRRFRADKRQLPPIITTLFDPGVATINLDLEKLDRSLDRLAAVSPERARLVELRFFAGLSIEETAESLGISAATVKRQWDVARAWLLRDINQTSPAAS